MDTYLSPVDLFLNCYQCISHQRVQNRESNLTKVSSCYSFFSSLQQRFWVFHFLRLPKKVFSRGETTKRVYSRGCGFIQIGPWSPLFNTWNVYYGSIMFWRCLYVFDWHVGIRWYFKIIKYVTKANLNTITIPKDHKFIDLL